MTKAEIKKLDLRNGIYRVYWKSGGSSVAALGCLPNGDRWLAPTNWLHPTEDQHVWRSVELLEALAVASPGILGGSRR